MPTINISKIDLESLLQRNVSIEELEPLFRLVKGELKGIEGDELKVEIADTNRPDLLSVEGIARQIKVNQKSKIKNQKWTHWTSLFERKGEFEIIVEPELLKIRPYIGGFVAKGIAITERALIAFIQTQEKLCELFGRKRKNIAIGVYNAQKIKFPIFYKAVFPEDKKFIPLGFEQELNLKEILEIHPKGKDYGYILNGMQKFPLLEDSQDETLSFPPIINSRLTGEVRPGDTHIFCELTGTDIEQLALIVNILASNFKDRGAEIEPCTIKYPYPTQLGKIVITPYDFKLRLSIKRIEFERVLGKKFTPIEVKEKLENMGYKVKILGEKFHLTVPPYRKDVMHPVDVIEDLAISIGYDSFEPVALEEFTLGKPAPIQSILDKARGIMVGCGFEEVMSNVLTSKDRFFSNMRLPAKEEQQAFIEVENPVSDSYAMLRNSIIPLLMSVEAQSSKATYPHRIFEVGEVVITEPGADLRSKTEFRLATLIAHPSSNFSELHSFLDTLTYYLNFSYKLEKIDYPSFIKGRVANIIVGAGLVPAQKKMGLIGEVHPEVLENFKIKCPVTAFELSMNFYEVQNL